MKYTLYSSLTALFVASTNLYASNRNDQPIVDDTTSQYKKQVIESNGEEIINKNKQPHSIKMPGELLKLIFLEVSPKDIDTLITVSKDFFHVINSYSFKKLYVDKFVLKGNFSPDLQDHIANITINPHDSFNTYANKVISIAFQHQGFDLTAIQYPFRRLAIATHAPKLFTEDMYPMARLGIFGALATIPANQIVDRINTIETYACILFTQDMDGNSCASIIEVLATIPADQIVDRINTTATQACILFTEDMEGYDRARLIQKFLKVSPEELEEAIAMEKEHI